MAQHPYREAKEKESIDRIGLAFARKVRCNSRLKDLQRSYIPEVGLAQHPEARKISKVDLSESDEGAYQVRDHNLRLSS